MTRARAAVQSRRQNSPAIEAWLAMLLALALLIFASPVHAQDEHITETQIGPFHVTGEWTVKESSVSGKGEIDLHSFSGDIDGNTAWMQAKEGAILSEQDADEYIARQTQRDPDLWVIEIEDRAWKIPCAGKVM